MPSDIGVKMSVSGVSQFKSAMNDAKGSVKALDAELKLNAAQYKASGDAETYYANRAKILADQIKAQEEVVSNAEKALETMTSQGVKKADKAYTQMQATLAQAKTRLVEMQQAANGAGDELEETGKTADSTAKSLSKLSAGMAFQNLSKVFEGVDNILKNILTKAVRIGETVWNWGRDAGRWADDLATRATMYGMDVETLQGYEHAADKIDTDVDTIIKASDKLSAKAKDTGEGIALITPGSTQFGIALTDAAGEARSQMDVLWDFIEVLGQIGNETDRNAIAQEYFGKSYRELIPLIEEGRSKWEAAAKGADVVSNDNVNKLVKMNDTMDELDQKLQTTWMTLLANLSPAFEKVADALGRMLDRIGEWAESDEGQATMSRIGDALAGLIENFADGGFEKLFDGAVSAVEKISEFLQSITSGDMLSTLETIGKIIAGWKIAETGIKTWNLIKSLRPNGNGTEILQTVEDIEKGGFGRTLLNLIKWGSGIGLGAWAAHSLLNQSGDAEDEPYWGKGAKIGSYKGKDLYVNGMGYFSYDQNGYARTLGGDYAGLRIFGEEGYFGFQDAFRNAFEGKATGGTYYQLLQESEDSADGLLVQINEAGELMTAYIADVNTFVKEWASESAVNDRMAEAGEQMSESVYEGATANIAAAYNAGAALAAAFADGASSVGAGNGGSATYNSEYVNAVNVYGVTSPEQIAAAYREVLKKQTAGYGG